MGALLKNKMLQRVILLAVVLLLVYLSYKFIGKIGSDFKNNQESKKHKKQLNELLNANTVDVGGAISQNAKTYKTAAYNLMADSLLAAMDGPGTKEDTIYAILSRLRTKADWFELVAAFGEKSSSSVFNIFSTFKGTLPKWLSDELGGDDKVRVNNLLGKFNVQI